MSDETFMGDETLRRTLTEWTDSIRLDAARRQRNTERWHELISAETATLEGLLTNLHETSQTVQILTAHGRSHHGMLSVLGRDFVAIQGERPLVIVPFAMIAGVQLAGRHRRQAASSGHDLETGPRFVEILTSLAETRSRVRLVTSATDKFQVGEVTAVSEALLTLATAGPPALTHFIPLNQISEATTE